MPNEEVRSDHVDKGERPRYQVRLPGFITDVDIGFRRCDQAGDVCRRHHALWRL